LCFPDGHASNISRLVNLDEFRCYGMKSHDYYVFMQTLIPSGYRDLLLKGIWDALMEISHFIRNICSNKLQTHDNERLETNAVRTICKLEMIFPPSFFDSIEHLLIYLLSLGRNASVSLSLLSLGPERKVKCYNEYFVNGYVFHTK
jgi:hypothetical protein